MYKEEYGTIVNILIDEFKQVEVEVLEQKQTG